MILHLHRALETAVKAKGHFTVVSDQPVHRQPWLDWYAPYDRSIVFWPLRNTPTDIHRFLSALYCGVVPVMTAANMPKLRYQELRQRYPNWGYLDEQGRICGEAISKANKEVLFVASTSGSTGDPKFFAANYSNIKASVSSIHQAQQLDHVKSTGVWLPLYYSFALINQLFWSVLYKKTLVLLPGMRQPADSFAKMRETKTEMICWVNSQARVIKQLGFSAEDALPDVKQVNFGGAPFPMQYVDYLKILFPNAELVNNYGCTEALSRMSMCRVKDGDQDITWVGKPIRCVKMRIQEGTETGKLEFSGESRTPGEMQNDGSILPYDEWVGTGDTGKIVNGEIYVHGRYDQIFNAGGERLSLMEIENVLLKIPTVENALVWTFTPHEGEEAPLAVIHGATLPSAEELDSHLRNYLSPRAWPTKIYIADEWPLTDRGKTDRVRIKEKTEKGGYQMFKFAT